MSKKRFQKTRIVDKWGGIYDSETDELLNMNNVEHKLNEQQATIQSLKEENEQLKKEHKIAIDEMITDYKNLEKENEQLKNRLNKGL